MLRPSLRAVESKGYTNIYRIGRLRMNTIRSHRFGVLTVGTLTRALRSGALLGQGPASIRVLTPSLR